MKEWGGGHGRHQNPILQPEQQNAGLSQPPFRTKEHLCMKALKYSLTCSLLKDPFSFSCHLTATWTGRAMDASLQTNLSKISHRGNFILGSVEAVGSEGYIQHGADTAAMNL